MKRLISIFPLMVLLLSPALFGQEPTEPVDTTPAPVAVETWGERITVGDRLLIPENTVHRGSITCISGILQIQGTVRGDVFVVGGELTLSGTVEGEVVAILADVNLLETAVIRYGLIQVAGSLNDAGGYVGRDRVNIPLGLSLPGFHDPLGVLLSIFLWWMLLGLVLLFIALLVLTALVPERIELLADETPLRPFGTFLAGLAFSVLGLPLIYLLTIISVVGIPLLPFVYFTFLILKWLGMAGFFLFFGRKLGRMVTSHVSTLGGVLLGFLFFGVLKLVPFLGAALWLGFGWYGLGLILLTRCGTRRSGVPVTAPLPTPTPPDAPVEPSETVD